MSWWQTEAEGIQAPQMKLVCGVFLHVAEGTEGKKREKTREREKEEENRRRTGMERIQEGKEGERH